MPIYEYVCQDCEKPFEKLVFKSGQPVECPSCGSGQARMQLSVFSARSSSGSSGDFGASGGGCGCIPSGCGCK